MGIEGLGKPKFFLDGVGIGEIQTAWVEVEKDEPEYETVKLPNLTDISLSGTFVGDWELLAQKIRETVARINVLEEAERISKQIRRSSYRKTKSQRRRG